MGTHELVKQKAVRETCKKAKISRQKGSHIGCKVFKDVLQSSDYYILFYYFSRKIILIFPSDMDFFPYSALNRKVL